MDLWNEKYIRDKTPLVEGCACQACSRHTRTYIHHLLKSKELLAEVLLYAHNHHTLLLLFRKAGERMRQGEDVAHWLAEIATFHID